MISGLLTLDYQPKIIIPSLWPLGYYPWIVNPWLLLYLDYYDPWIVNPGLWSLNYQPWIVNPGLSTLDYDPWIVNPGLWSLDYYDPWIAMLDERTDLWS